MTLADRLRSLAASLPSDASAVSFTRADLLALVEGSTDKAGSPKHERDLSVEEVAEQTGRAPSTVRGWLNSRKLRGYKLQRARLAGYRGRLAGLSGRSSCTTLRSTPRRPRGHHGMATGELRTA